MVLRLEQFIFYFTTTGHQITEEKQLQQASSKHDIHIERARAKLCARVCARTEQYILHLHTRTENSGHLQKINPKYISLSQT